MSIYVTGDCHGDWRRFNERNFPDQKKMTKEDFVLICGDFGLWHDTKEEQKKLKWLNEKPFTTLFIDGNHENFDRLFSNEFTEVDFHGGKAKQIRDRIYYLERGQVFTLQEKRFFTFGGAKSHDVADGIIDRRDFKSDEAYQRAKMKAAVLRKKTRINHESWWKEELPTEEEMELARENLRTYDNKVDFVVTHCAPQSILEISEEGKYPPDVCTMFLDHLDDEIEFENWFFGHYHQDRRILIKYFMMFQSIIKIC